MILDRRPLPRIVLGAVTLLVLAAALLGPGRSAVAAPPNVDFYGYLKADAIYDFKRMATAWNATMRPSQIPIAYPGDGELPYTDGEFVFSVKTTRLGAWVRQPTSGREIVARVEMDLYGTGVNAGQIMPRLRHAYVTYGKLLVGHTWTLFSAPDVCPSFQLEYWCGSGLMITRRAVVRWTPVAGDGRQFAVALENADVGVDAGKGPSIDPDFAARQRSLAPDLTVQYELRGERGFVQVAAVARILGYEGRLDSVSTFHGDVFGGGGSVCGRAELGGRWALMGSLAYGKGIAGYTNDGGFDVSGDGSGGGLGRAKALPLLGWSVGFDKWLDERWTVSGAASQTIQKNSGGQLDDVFRRGSYAVLGTSFRPQAPLLYGIELQWGERRNKDGRHNHDIRIQGSMKYSF